MQIRVISVLLTLLLSTSISAVETAQYEAPRILHSDSASEVSFTDPSEFDSAKAASKCDSATFDELGGIELAAACCKICKKGKACGNSCISKNKDCHKPPGCACNG